MCGIAGFILSERGMPVESMETRLRRMSGTLIHRGPDAGGEWSDSLEGVGLTHRRLSIQDLSSQGSQPMRSRSGRYVLSFNGEIYNHRRIRSDLEGGGWSRSWRGTSDTETMLAAFEAWGPQEAIRRFEGMFAFALWDSVESRLRLAVDRLGEKPVYYGWRNGNFVFGSELKALMAFPGSEAEIDRDALSLYMRFNYVPAPRAIYKGISKIPSGCMLTVSARSGDDISPEPYWALEDAFEAGRRNPFIGNDTDAIDELSNLLSFSIKDQMISDVPLGAFLSGGIDSSLIVSLMQFHSSTPVKTFTIGFSNPGYDEAAQAAAIARHLGTDHTELYLGPAEALNVVPELSRIWDEPFSDSSQIPTLIVSRLARSKVAVSLSGDGGDELFGGYNRYFWGPSLWRGFGHMPITYRRLSARLLASIPSSFWDQCFSAAAKVLPRSMALRTPGEKIHKLAENMMAHDFSEFYSGLLSHWKIPGMVIGSRDVPCFLSRGKGLKGLGEGVERMQFLDTLGYLNGDILTKLDRAGMSASLESRIPFLNHKIVEFAWRLPMSLKIRNGKGKWILRQILGRHVPESLVNQPKMGFSIPIHAWLRGPLRDWSETLLSESRLRHEGYLDPRPIRKKWEEHIKGIGNWQHHIWDVLMFQSWLESQAVSNQSSGSLDDRDRITNSGATIP